MLMARRGCTVARPCHEKSAAHQVAHSRYGRNTRAKECTINYCIDSDSISSLKVHAITELICSILGFTSLLTHMVLKWITGTVTEYAAGNSGERF